MRPSAKALGTLGILASLLCYHSQPANASFRPLQTQRKSRIQCYTSFDSEYLYVAATVQKPNLAGSQKDYFSDVLKDDAIAVFLQTEEAAAGQTRTQHSVSMAVSAAGGVQLYRGGDAHPLTKFTDFLNNSEMRPVPFKASVQIRGQLNQPGGDNTSYTVEMAIPWVEVGGPPTVGQKCRFNVISYSAAPGSAPIVSLAPGVKTLEDVQNPSLWDEIVFVDAPVKTVASAPKAKVSARLFSVKPLIDGILAEGEWNTLTAFGFNETSTGTEAVAPTIGISRVRPKVNLHKARPAINPPASESGEPAARVPQSVPHLVFTLYNYDIQNDTRKAAPAKTVNSLDGSSLLPSHPMEGLGPWLTYDRVDWHRKQMQDVRRAGIDVIAPRYRADVFSKQRYSIRGLQTLVDALRSLENSGQDFPLISLYLDTTSISDSKGERPDLHSQQGSALVYAAIKDFYQQIPAAYRASIQMTPQNGGSLANIVVLSSAEPFTNVDDGFIAACRSAFRRDFGRDLIILGSSDFKGKAKLDGYVNDTGGRGFQMDDGGWIKPASVGPGYDHSLEGVKEAPIRTRNDGNAYRADWKQAIAKRADWVFIDGWNDFSQGSEIAPSLQNGIEYVDMTRLFTREFAGVTPYRAGYINHSLPGVSSTSTSWNASVRVANTGTTVWPADTTVLTARWTKQDGSAAGDTTTIPLTNPVIPGQAANIPLSLTTPSQPGTYVLRLEMGQIKKKTDPVALFGPEADALRATVVVKAADPGAASGISLVSQDFPATAEAGGTYTASVTLRNDGQKAWKKSGGRIIARVWRYTSAINSTGEPERAEVIEMADAGADLPADVAPGQQVSLSVPITFSTADGSPLSSWSQADNWTYALRWEYSADENGTEGAVSSPQPLALIDADLGPQFISDLTPNQLPGDRRLPIKLGIRNRGPQTWLKDKVRIGYHWYYLDGTEAVWQDETTPIPADVEPGGEIKEILTWITPPAYDGAYYLVWDLKVGDSWASTLPSVRPNETHVLPVEVVKGRLTLVDLSKSFNQDGVTFASGLSDGDFDGTGRTLPAELIPPFANTDTAPSTLWLPLKGTGLDSSRRISFRWGPKGDKERNILQCVGQKVPLVDAKKSDSIRLMHILAATTKADKLAEFTIVFADGTQQLNTFFISKWDGPPTHGEEMAAFCRYSNTRSGPAMDKPVALHHYVIKIGDKKKIAAIILPNAPDIKIAAITLEK